MCPVLPERDARDERVADVAAGGVERGTRRGGHRDDDTSALVEVAGTGPAAARPSIPAAVRVAAAASTARHRPLARRIWRGVRQATRTSAGDITIAATQRARDVATLRRLSEYRNSMPRGASSGVDVPIA